VYIWWKEVTVYVTGVAVLLSAIIGASAALAVCMVAVFAEVKFYK
jgi:hypothetical protein